MICHEPGVLPGSEYFIGHQDSRFDPALHPAVMLCGHYHCISGPDLTPPCTLLSCCADIITAFQVMALTALGMNTVLFVISATV